MLGRTTSPTACRTWRINVGHDLKTVDPVTNVPLAAQVCYNVSGLQFSFQTDTFQNILSYQAGSAVVVGPLLSALCAFSGSRRCVALSRAWSLLRHVRYMRRSCMRWATLS